MVYARIIGTGSYLPERVVTNEELAQREFVYNGIQKTVTPEKIFEITGMKERHYARPGEHVEDLAVRAARIALCEARSDPEIIIVAHDSKLGANYSPIPPISALIQGKTGIPFVGMDIITDGSVDGALIAATLENKYCRVAYMGGGRFSSTRTIDKLGGIAVHDETGFLLYDHGEVLGQSRASLVAKKLGLRTNSFDVVMGCSGFVGALELADQLIRSEAYRHILVIGAEKLSALADPRHLDSTLYGDGAGAFMLEASDQPGIIDINLKTFGDSWQLLTLQPGIDDKENLYITMNGKRVYTLACKTLPDIVNELLKRDSLSITDIDLIVPHQMNGNILETLASKLYGAKDEALKALIDKYVAWSMHRISNCSVATTPITLDLVLRENLNRRFSQKPFDIALNSGKLVLMPVLGAGMNGGVIGIYL